MKRAASLVLVLTMAISASPALAKKSNWQQQQLLMQQQALMQAQAANPSGEAAAEEAARQAYVIQTQNSAAAMAAWQQQRANAHSAYAAARAHGFQGWPYSSWNNVTNESQRQLRCTALQQQIGRTMDSGQRAELIKQLKYLQHHRF